MSYRKFNYIPAEQVNVEPELDEASNLAEEITEEIVEGDDDADSE